MADDVKPLETKTPKDVIHAAKERGAKIVDLRFIDVPGLWQHFSIPTHDLDEELFSEGIGFDGSSIRGFTVQHESDLRLGIDWPAFYWLPSDVFGPGKVLVFGQVLEKDGSPYAADMRSRLKAHCQTLFDKDGTTCHASNEIEGFLFKGRDAERRRFATVR